MLLRFVLLGLLMATACAPLVPTPTTTSTPFPTATTISIPSPTPTPDQGALELLAIASGQRCAGLASLKAVTWDTYPSINDANRLTMSGRVEEGAPRIKDARKSVNRTRHPAFTFYALEEGTNERGNFSSVGRLWPRDIEPRLSGKGSPNAFAEAYDVTDYRFDVAAILPSSILEHRLLYVSVWSELIENNPMASGSTAALGSCKVWRY